MLYNIIDNMKKRGNIIQDLDLILDNIKEQLGNNFDLIDDFYFKFMKSHLDKDIIINKFNKLEDNKYGLREIYKNNEFTISNSYREYGVVGLVIKNDLSIYNVLEIISMLIQTRNNIIIETSDLVLSLIIKEINKILIQIDTYSEIVIYNDLDKKLEDNEDLDLLIYIGNRSDYNNINTKCNKKFYGIGKYELYIDYELDNNLIEEAKKQGVIVYYKDLDLDRLINTCNKKTNGYCASIMSNNNKNIEKFIRNVNVTYTLVNIIPTLEDRVNIEITDLLQYRSIVTYK